MNRIRTTPLAMLSLLMVALSHVFLAGCSDAGDSASSRTASRPIAKATSKPATTQAATQPAPPPAKETVTVDFSKLDTPVTRKAAGFSRAMTLTEPPLEMIAPLRPVIIRLPVGEEAGKYDALEVYSRAKSLGAKVQVELTGLIKFEGKWPAEKGGWTKWDNAVRAVVKKTVERKMQVEWDIWNEPNTGQWKGTRDEYFGLYGRTVRLIKSVDPNAVILGPSIHDHDGGWFWDFMKFSKEYEVLPDTVAWYESAGKTDIPNRVRDIEVNMWQDGHGMRPIEIHQYVNDDKRFNPAVTAISFSSIERSRAVAATRKPQNETGTQLCNLLTKEFRPRASWYVYKEYAELAGSLAAVTAGATTDGVAAWDGSTRSARVLIGRDAWRTAKAGDKQPSRVGELELRLRFLPVGKAHITARRIPSSGDKELLETPVTLDKDFEITSDRDLRILLPEFVDATAYAVTITMR